MMTFAEFKAIVEKCSYQDWEFRCLEKGDGFLLQIRFRAPDSRLDDARAPAVLQSCRKWYVSAHSEPGEVVRTCWKAVEAAVIHEALEAFKYRGVAIFNPHLSPDQLAEMKQQIGHREELPELEYSEVRSGPESIWS